MKIRDLLKELCFFEVEAAAFIVNAVVEAVVVVAVAVADDVAIVAAAEALLMEKAALEEVGDEEQAV